MPRIAPLGSKFKRIETSIRQKLISYTKVLEEIDKALAAKRTEQDEVLLRTIRQQWIESHKQAVKVVEHLFVQLVKD